MALPLTVVPVPTVVPPVVQVVGAVAWGPKTVKVTVPRGSRSRRAAGEGRADVGRHDSGRSGARRGAGGRQGRRRLGHHGLGHRAPQVEVAATLLVSPP